MNGAYEIGKLFDVRIRVHVTFLVLVAAAALSGLVGGGLTGMVTEVVFVAALFGLVVLHELGHVLTARQFGIPTIDICLLPIGGVARIAGEARRPGHEILIALAGPAVNMALATLTLPLLAIGAGPVPGADGLLSRLLSANVALALFNLLPAFPMDGGRVLRALLSERLGRREATRIAASTGQASAVAMGVIGLVMAPWLAIVAVFLWLAASHEKQLNERLSEDGWPWSQVWRSSSERPAAVEARVVAAFDPFWTRVAPSRSEVGGRRTRVVGCWTPEGGWRTAHLID